MSTGSVINTSMVVVGAERLMQRTSDNRSDIRSVKRTAGDALDTARRIAESGDWLRLVDPRLRDLIVGLCFPEQAAPEQSSPFAGVPITVERPSFGEDVLGSGEYPQMHNEYQPDGDLLNPSQVMSGANFATGVALGFPELRALLLGSAFGTTPSPEELKRTHRHQRALFEAIRELGALTHDDAINAWRRFFNAGGPGTLWTLLDNTSTFSTVGEHTYVAFTLPKNFLAVGETLEVQWAVSLAGGATCEYSPFLALGDHTGQKIWFTNQPYDPSDFGAVGLHGGEVAVRITRRANDPSGGNRFAISGTFGATGWSCGNDHSTVLAIDHSVDQDLALCFRQGVAAMASYAYRGTARRL